MASYGLVQIRWNRVRPTGQPAEDIAVNTLHCQVTDGGWTTDDRDVFNSAWETFWETTLRTLVSSEYSPNERRFYNLPATPGPSGDPAFTITGGTAAATGSASAELPPQIAMTITLITAIRRRWGRIYIPGLTTAALDTGRIGASTISTLANDFQAFGESLRGSGQGLVVWHRAGWTPEDVTSIRIDDTWDVQRRRRWDHSFHEETRSLLS